MANARMGKLLGAAAVAAAPLLGAAPAAWADTVYVSSAPADVVVNEGQSVSLGWQLSATSPHYITGVSTTINWGDGSSQSGTSGNHLYARPGNFTAVLSGTATSAYQGYGQVSVGQRWVSTGWGNGYYEYYPIYGPVTLGDPLSNLYDAVNVSVLNLDPVLSALPDMWTTVNQSFDFSASAFDYTALTYHWDFDNNGTYDYVGQSGSRTFGAAGTYRMGVLVTDEYGGAAYGSFNVNVTAGAVAAAPLPSSAWAGLALLGGLGAARHVRQRRHRFD